MRYYFLHALFLSLFFVNAISAEDSAPQSPNVILVFMDDMGYADIGAFGSDVPTPNLDRMAAEGRRFTNFCVTSPVCSASRSALMTGCYNQRVGINGALMPTAKIGLNPEEETIAEICKKKGYATACFGKWHLGHHSRFLPLNQGFDEYFGLPYSNDMWPWGGTYDPARGKVANHPPLPLIEGMKTIKPEVTPEDQKMLTTWYTERAVDFIKRHKDEPFFLYLPHSMVHVPLFVSEKFAGKSSSGIFGDVVMEIDWSMGQIFETLRELKLDKNTLVIFTSDNGPSLRYGTHAGSAAPLREGKNTAFEGGVREPTLFWWPDKIPAGTTCDQLASTIAHLIGTELPAKKIDGKDIRPLMFGEPGAKSPHEAYAIYGGAQLKAVRDNRWKLVLPQTYPSMVGKPKKNDGTPSERASVKITSPELYDLQNDISETSDVSKDHPEIVRRLLEEATRFREELGDGKADGPGVRPPGRVD